MRFLKKQLKPNHEKIILQTTLTKNWNKLILLNITKAHISKHKLISANRVPRCSQNNRQDIIG